MGGMTFKAVLIDQGFQTRDWGLESERKNDKEMRRKLWEEGRNVFKSPEKHSVFCGLTYARDVAPTKQT